MRKGLLLLILFLLATILSAQNIMKVWSNDTLIEFDISTIDSITFEVKTESVGVFSVANNKRVAFAPGNLQYIPTADTWLFAANQYDYIGTRNMVNQAFADTIDLFAWSTDTDPSTAWGVTLEDNNDLYAGNFVDWGTTIGDGNTWRTLTSTEWEYIRAKRPNASKLIGVGSINGIHGLILLPDGWIAPDGITFKVDTATRSIVLLLLKSTNPLPSNSGIRCKLRVLSSCLVLASDWGLR